MVPINILQHIMNTVQQLYIRPVVLLCGDSRQQQPIETVDRKIQPANSILEYKPFYAICNRVNFVTQNPNQRLLDRLEHDRIIFHKTAIGGKDIRKLPVDQPEAHVLSVSCKSINGVNKIALTLFDTESLLWRHHLRQRPWKSIVIQRIKGGHHSKQGETAKRSGKWSASNSGVSRRRFRASSLSKRIHFLRISRNAYRSRRQPQNYPFTPAYSSTITKIQGQNMMKIILWLDCEKEPKGAAYVALSRIPKHKDLFFMHKTSVHQYLPVQLDPSD